jgi:uncharacterized protein YkwD
MQLSVILSLGLQLLSVFPGQSVIDNQTVAPPLPALDQVVSFVPPRTKLQAVQQLALELVNHDRAKVGLRPMQADALLCRAAQSHAVDMLRRNYFSHYSPEGWSPKDFLWKVGGIGMPSENIAMQEEPRFRDINIQILETYEDQWMQSPSHRHHLMNPNFRKFGYGLAFNSHNGRSFAVQMFSRH